MQLLKMLNNMGKTIIMVTHSKKYKLDADRIIEIETFSIHEGISCGKM